MDALAVTIARLREGLGVWAGAEVPEPRPKTFITVERTGGGAQDRLDHPELAVQSWAQTNLEAHELARRADALMLDLPLATEVMGVTRTTLTDWPDPDSRSARYQGVYQLTAPI